MVAASLFANKDTAAGFQQLACRAPIAAGVAGIVCTKTFQDIIKHVPIVGSYVSCKNTECTGICSDCKLTKIALAIGIYRAVDVGIQLVPSLFPTKK